MSQEPSPKRARIESSSLVHALVIIDEEEGDYYKHYMVPITAETEELIDRIENPPNKERLETYEKGIEDLRKNRNIKELLCRSKEERGDRVRDDLPGLKESLEKYSIWCPINGKLEFPITSVYFIAGWE